MFLQTMAAKRTAGLASTVPRPSLNDEELVCFITIILLFFILKIINVKINVINGAILNSHFSLRNIIINLIKII